LLSIFRIVILEEGPKLINEMVAIAHRREIRAALTALAMGVAIYLLERSGADLYLLPDSWQAVLPVSTLGNHMPSFLHVFAFAILTAVVLAPWRGAVMFSCLLWVVINSLFEIGQADAVAARISRSTPVWFGDWPFLENIDSYFLHGTFDPIDIGFAALGAVAAYLMLLCINPAGEPEC
jgi:hypothetical protein